MDTVAAIWRYPVKSMAGERMSHAEVNADGLAHDRLYAFESSDAPAGMLRVSGPQRRELLRYQARVDRANNVRVRAPDGQDFAVENDALLGAAFKLTLEAAPQTDVRPLSLISLQTIQQLQDELQQLDEPAIHLDPRRFRANFYLDLAAGAFAEDAFTGRTLRLGATVTILVRERDPRCRFITYNPASPHLAPPLFGLMKLLDRRHQGRAGVYASVLTPGVVTAGDAVTVVG